MSDRTKSLAAPAEQELLSVGLTVNGERRTIAVEPRTTLLEALRETLALTGTKGLRPASAGPAPCTSTAAA